MCLTGPRFSTSTTLVWILGLLTLATQIAGGVSFLQAHRLAAPRLAIATGVVFLVSSAVSLLMLIFLGESGFRLPWTVRLVMMALAATGLLAAYTLAGVHHLQMAGVPRPILWVRITEFVANISSDALMVIVLVVMWKLWDRTTRLTSALSRICPGRHPGA